MGAPEEARHSYPRGLRGRAEISQTHTVFLCLKTPCWAPQVCPSCSRGERDARSQPRGAAQPVLAANRCKTKENAELVSFILPLREGRARPRARPGPAPLAWVPRARLGAGRVAGSSPGLLARDEPRAHGHLEHLLLSIASCPRQLGHSAATAQHQDPLSPAAVSTPGRARRAPRSCSTHGRVRTRSWHPEPVLPAGFQTQQ